MKIQNKNRIERPILEDSKSDYPTDKTSGFIFSTDIRDWYGRQTNVKNKKRKR